MIFDVVIIIFSIFIAVNVVLVIQHVLNYNPVSMFIVLLFVMYFGNLYLEFN